MLRASSDISDEDSALGLTAPPLYNNSGMGGQEQKKQQTNHVDASLDSSAVTVSDAQTVGEGRNKTTTYCVRVQSPDNPSMVRRRYSDFQWLYNRFHSERPGAVVPIIPHKTALQASTRFSEEFVEERRRNLQIFLQRVMQSPELRDSSCLGVFLRADDDTFQGEKKSHPVTEDNWSEHDSGHHSAANDREAGAGQETTGRGRRIRNLLQKTVAAVSVAGRQTELETTEEEDAVSEIGAYVAFVDGHVKTLAKLSFSLTKNQRESGKILDDMGMGFSTMGESMPEATKTDMNDAQARNLFIKIGDGLSAVSALVFQSVTVTERDFDEPVQDLAQIVVALRRAVQRRRQLQLTCTAKTQQVQFKAGALRRVEDNVNPGAERLHKLSAAQAALAQAEAERKAARATLEAATARLLREVERFKRGFQVKVRRIVQNLVALRVEQGKRVEQQWELLLPHLANHPSSSLQQSSSNNTNLTSKVSRQSDGAVWKAPVLISM